MKKKSKLQIILELVVFAMILTLAIFNPLFLKEVFFYRLLFFKTYHVLWVLALIIMICALFPRFNKTLHAGKIFVVNYSENKVKVAGKADLLKKYVEKMNKGALKSAVLWLICLAILGTLYFFGVIDMVWIIVLFFFFIVLEQIFTFIWCPFRNWLIKNKCCRSCRIHNWGYLMALSPLVFIPPFWTYSLLAVATIVLIQWEYLHYKHPERFFELYNANLMCKNCDIQCKNSLKQKTIL